MTKQSKTMITRQGQGSPKQTQKYAHKSYSSKTIKKNQEQHLKSPQSKASTQDQQEIEKLKENMNPVKHTKKIMKTPHKKDDHMKVLASIEKQLDQSKQQIHEIKTSFHVDLQEIEDKILQLIRELPNNAKFENILQKIMEQYFYDQLNVVKNAINKLANEGSIQITDERLKQVTQSPFNHTTKLMNISPPSLKKLMVPPLETQHHEIMVTEELSEHMDEDYPQKKEAITTEQQYQNYISDD